VFLIVPRAFRLLAAFHKLSLRMLFGTLSGLEIFTSFGVLRCGGRFAAVALSLQNLFRWKPLSLPNLFRTRFSWSIEVMQLVF